MKLYQWDTFQNRFTSAACNYSLPAAERVTLSSLQVSKGERVQSGSATAEQMICVLRGAWRLNIAGNQLIVRRNEAVVIPPGFEHTAEAIQDSFALQMIREEN
jgi:quercetin dioxygenase-like cupin family protein